MRSRLIFTLATILMFSAVLAPTSNTKSDIKNMNKSPCFEEDVYACQASGGTFDWRHCTCWYW